jgi:3-deoxy-D-manno-octulosonic-acid transferase
MEPIFVNTLSITGSKLENYKELKEELCDTNIIETFNQPNQLRALVNKYKDEDRRREKLAVQKNALKNKSGSYDEIIKSIDEL